MKKDKAIKKKCCNIRFLFRLVFPILAITILIQCVGFFLVLGGPTKNYNEYAFSDLMKKRNTDAITKSSDYLQRHRRPYASSSSLTRQQRTQTKISSPLLVQSPVLLRMMKKTKEMSQRNDSNIVITRPTRQGYYFHKDFLNWNLVPPALALSSENRNNTHAISTSSFTNTICVTEQNRYIGSTPSIQERFYNIDIDTHNNWSYLLSPPSKTKSPSVELDNACKYSRVRIILERNVHGGTKYHSKLKIKLLSEHQEGRQLTGRILGGADVDKGSLITMIHNSSSSDISSSQLKLLKNSIPTTYVFHSTESCERFCMNIVEWSNQQPQQHWIFKAKFLSEGQGIASIGSTVDDCCHYCINVGGDTLTAQSVLANPLTLSNSYHDDNKRHKYKFDVRSFILVANVHPLFVYAGGEYVRICAEPMSPETTSTWKWNKYQQVCNLGMTKTSQQSSLLYHEDPSKFVRPFVEDSVIPDIKLREKLIKKIDQHNSALVELLYKERWTNPIWMDDNGYDDQTTAGTNRNKVGMFQGFAADYLIADTVEHEIVLLELNSQPGYTGRFGIDYPNPWGDVMLIEWTILAVYNKYHSNTNDNNRHGGGGAVNVGVEDEEDDWKIELEQRLSELDLETLRRLKVVEDNMHYKF